ncbi:MAG: hypothetical protein HOQ22_04895 [Nocardioidaceae bacterium]|nr:hypothetical protein [Nocardioidaceae bacterium]NUS50363.1 hypothetical protein [Nocardioidaceae bacterium]
MARAERQGDPHSAAATVDPGVLLMLRRRTLLAALAGTGAAAAVTVWRASPAAAAVTVDEFMELSEVLTDKVADLRDDVGAQYLAFLRADPAFAAPLERLVAVVVRAEDPPRTFDELLDTGALDDPANAETARQVLILWYSGLVDGRTADYLEALAWSSQDFAEPASTPLGFPKWEDRP